MIRKLKEKAGALADKIHTGRSRNEQVSLDMRLWLREEMRSRARALLAGLMQALLELARSVSGRGDPRLHAHAPRAGGAVAALPAGVFRNVRARLRALRRGAARASTCCRSARARWRAAAFPSTAKPSRAIWASTAITRNSMDVSADRDFALDFLYAASTTMLHLSRLAEDWILYSSEEFGWMELGDGVTSGSSLMPQKKNPDSLELIRGKCGRVFGRLHLAVHDHEGPAHDLQPRHAGGQGAAVRRGGSAVRLARNGARGGRHGQC